MNAREWARLLRWYPREWRERNGAAIVGTLMDEAEGAGRSRPTASTRFSLVLGGLRQRVLGSERSSGLNVTALSLGVAFSTFYLGVITWSPGVQFAGAFGPFTNPSIVTGVLLAIALAFALSGRAGGARVFAGLAIVSAVAIGVLATTQHWLGPGLKVTALFIALGVLGAARIRGGLRAALLLGAVALVEVTLSSLEYIFLAGVFLPDVTVFTLLVAGAASLAAIALVLAAIATPAPRLTR